MIERVGLLPADNTQQIPFAWSMYIRGKWTSVQIDGGANQLLDLDDEDAVEDCAIYKRTFSANVIIDFVGVWYDGYFSSSYFV